MPDIICPIYRHANIIPDQIALETPERTLTYAELNAALENHVTLLKNGSIQAGLHVAFIAKTSLSSILLLFSLFRLKAVACPLSFRIPPEQITALTERCSASHLLNPEDLPIITTICSSEPPIYDLNQIATILMTSGSSGTPKAACHTLQNHFSNAEGVLSPLHCSTATRWLLSLPLFHVGGLAILFRCFMAGGTVVITDLALPCALTKCTITHASLVPTQLFRLLQEPEHQIAARCLLIGGAPLSTMLANQALARNLPIYPTYGMTEMSSMITLAKPEEITHQLHIGKPLHYRQLRVDEEGEILVRGEPLFAGYWDSKQQTLSRETRDGWFPTKDLGKIGPQGELTLLGRRDRMFISGGENIQPEEIEQAISELPGILAVKVVPVDDVEFGKRPIAYLLEEKPQHTTKSLSTALCSKLPSFKHPIHVFHSPLNTKII